MDGARARLVETHTAVLVFFGERVHKLKKPVELGFLDFRRRAAREAACHREVELNRRLAPDVYLGVHDVVDESGEPVDHLVVMRRLPSEARLAALVRTPRDVRAEIRAVARTVASFHARALRSAEIDRAATPNAVLQLWRETAEQMRPYVGPLLAADIFEHVITAAERYLAGRGPLLAARIAGGHVCDGHGDLLAEDIFCLPDGPRILDCLEFDDRLRHGDVLADVAFLCMDLERLGRADVAAHFLADYEEFTAESHPRSLLGHWIAYRALVRCKVACIRHTQGDADAAREARALLDIAFRHAERSRIQLILVGGLPGTGKSTLARQLSDALGATVLRSDQIRQELGGGHDARTTAATYAEMLHRARVLLEHGDTVVLDATWSDRGFRHAARRLARKTFSDVCELRCEAPAAVAERRIRRRLQRGDDVSRATPEVARRMAVTAHPWPSAHTIDTTLDPARSLARALHAVARSGTSVPADLRPSPLVHPALRHPRSASAIR